MEQGTAEEHFCYAVVIMPDENPKLSELIAFARKIEAIIEIAGTPFVVINDQSGENRRYVNPALFDLHALQDAADKEWFWVNFVATAAAV